MRVLAGNGCHWLCLSVRMCSPTPPTPDACPPPPDESLALADGEVPAALGDVGGEAAIEAPDELLEAATPEAAPELLVAYSARGVQVAAHRAGEEHRVLHTPGGGGSGPVLSPHPPRSGPELAAH